MCDRKRLVHFLHQISCMAEACVHKYIRNLTPLMGWGMGWGGKGGGRACVCVCVCDRKQGSEMGHPNISTTARVYMDHFFQRLLMTSRLSRQDLVNILLLLNLKMYIFKHVLAQCLCLLFYNLKLEVSPSNNGFLVRLKLDTKLYSGQALAVWEAIIQHKFIQPKVFEDISLSF